MSALKELMGKGLGKSRDDETDGPKPTSIGAGYMKRMFQHMQAGDFEKAFGCLEKASAMASSPDDEEGEDEESGEPSEY